jgi:hypothetical protein
VCVLFCGISATAVPLQLSAKIFSYTRDAFTKDFAFIGVSH